MTPRTEGTTPCSLLSLHPEYDEGGAFAYHGSAFIAGAGTVPDGTTGPPLTVAKTSGSEITLGWSASCLASDPDYAVYEGVLGDFSSHTSISCSTNGSRTWTFEPATGNRYYLVVPVGTHEGSYGTDSQGLERPQGLNPCRTQLIEPCS